MILVPFVFNNASENALRYAIAFAKVFDNIDIVCFHATENEKTDGTELNGLRRKLEGAIHQCKGDAEMEIKAHVVDGSYEDKIMDFTQKNLVDIIIVGTRNVTGLSKVLHEGRTAKFLNGVILPTLVIPEDYAYKPIEKIMWASDFKPIKNDDAMDPLVVIARAYDAEVRIAHVHTKRDNLDVMQINEMHRQEFLFSDKVKHSFKKIKRSTISKGIAHYLRLKGDNDMLVLIKRKTGFMDNLFRTENSIEFGVNPKLPILFIHEQADRWALKRNYDV